MLKNFVSKEESKVESNESEDESIATVQKKEVLMVLPFHGTDLSNELHRNLQSLCAKAYPQIELKLVFRTTFRICNLFNIKDVIPKKIQVICGVQSTLYKLRCKLCGQDETPH